MEIWQTIEEFPFNQGGPSGVYLIKFPNGKFYLGSSKRVYKRLRDHLCYLARPQNQTPWYQRANEENGKGTWQWWLEHITIYFFPCKNYKEKEDNYLRAIKDRSRYYNTQFWATKR